MTYVERTDDELMGALRAMANRIDAPPPEVVAAARSSFVFAGLADFAEAGLVYDSTWDQDDSRALVRSSAGPRELTFEGDGATIELEIVPVSGRQRVRRLVGQLVPPGRADLEVRHPSGSLTVAADDLGRFLVAATPAGPVSVRWTRHGAAPVVTEWIVI